jgi:hypothetical protein
MILLFKPRIKIVASWQKLPVRLGLRWIFLPSASLVNKE